MSSVVSCSETYFQAVLMRLTVLRGARGRLD
jgi:hypothetical protein